MGNSEIDSISLGERIAYYRKAMKLTQEDLADCIGVSRTHISNIEIGKSIPSLIVLVNIANELRVGVDMLLVGSIDISKAKKDNLTLTRIMEGCTYMEKRAIEKIISEIVNCISKEKKNNTSAK